jgi:hypothetical protein
MLRKLLAGTLAVAALAAWTSSGQATAPAAPDATVTTQRSSSEEGDQLKTCRCQYFNGYLYCYGDTCY